MLVPTKPGSAGVVSRNNRVSSATSSSIISPSATATAGASLLKLGMKTRSEQQQHQPPSSGRSTGSAAPLSFGWGSSLTSVYGASSDAVLDVLSSIDTAVRGTFHSTRDHYTAVCNALEITGKPNRVVMACCDAHDRLNELVMQWATEHAAENNIDKFTRVSEQQGEEENADADTDNKEQQQQRQLVVAAASTKFDAVTWESDTAANTSVTHADTRTEHRDKNPTRRLQAQVASSRRALLEAALKAGAADFENINSSPPSTAQQVLLLWNAPVLSSLDTSATVLGERGSVALFATLQVLPHLSSLSFKNSQLLSPFIAALAVLCRPRFLPRLRRLDLSGNLGGSLAVEALTELVRAHPLLVAVDTDGFEALPSTSRHLDRALEQNRQRNEQRTAAAAQRVGAEQAEKDEREATRVSDAAATLQRHLDALLDIEAKARGAVSQIEDAEFESEIVASGERERLAVAGFVVGRIEQADLQAKMARDEEVWAEKRETQRQNLEQQEQSARSSTIEKVAEKTFKDLLFDEETKREALLRNAAAHASLSAEMRNSSSQVATKSAALLAARAELEAARAERREGDRELVLRRRKEIEQALADTERREQALRGVEDGVGRAEASDRAFLLSMFDKERALWLRFAEEKVERERRAALEHVRRDRDEEEERRERELRDKNVFAAAQEEMRGAQRRLDEARAEQRLHEQQREEEGHARAAAAAAADAAAADAAVAAVAEEEKQPAAPVAEEAPASAAAEEKPASAAAEEEEPASAAAADEKPAADEEKPVDETIVPVIPDQPAAAAAAASEDAIAAVETTEAPLAAQQQQQQDAPSEPVPSSEEAAPQREAEQPPAAAAVAAEAPNTAEAEEAAAPTAVETTLPPVPNNSLAGAPLEAAIAAQQQQDEPETTAVATTAVDEEEKKPEEAAVETTAVEEAPKPEEAEAEAAEPATLAAEAVVEPAAPVAEIPAQPAAAATVVAEAVDTPAAPVDVTAATEKQPEQQVAAAAPTPADQPAPPAAAEEEHVAAASDVVNVAAAAAPEDAPKEPQQEADVVAEKPAEEKPEPEREAVAPAEASAAPAAADVAVVVAADAPAPMSPKPVSDEQRDAQEPSPAPVGVGVIEKQPASSSDDDSFESSSSGSTSSLASDDIRGGSSDTEEL